MTVMSGASGIDLGAPCPRVNFEMFPQCEGKRVRVVGKVEEVSGSTMKIKTSDDVLVDVLLQGTAPTDAYVEVDGTIEGGCRIREESPNVGLGNDFDLQNYNKVCTLMNGTYKNLFL